MGTPKERNSRKDKEVIDIILKNKKSGKVLDLGCGGAGNSLKLAEKGFNVTCIDKSSSVIQKLKRKEINVFKADLDNEEIKGKFDVILVLGVLHLLKNPKNLIRQIKKIVKKEGIVIIDTYSIENLTFKDAFSDWKILDYEEYSENNKKVIWICVSN